MQARVDPQDRHGSRPLHLAAGQGRVEAMRLLLKAGADPEAKVRHSFLNFMQQKAVTYIHQLVLMMETQTDKRCFT